MSSVSFSDRIPCSKKSSTWHLLLLNIKSEALKTFFFIQNIFFLENENTPINGHENTPPVFV
jgi:hypothetical protein